jgi:hypothetical protein
MQVHSNSSCNNPTLYTGGLHTMAAHAVCKGMCAGTGVAVQKCNRHGRGLGGNTRVCTHDVCAPAVCLAQHVEEEEVDIIVQGLVVQEQLGQVAQVLAVLLLLAAINLGGGG